MVAEAVVQEEAFLSVGPADVLMLCTEPVALAGSDAKAAKADESVLAAAPVPEGSLVYIDDVTSSISQDGGGADAGNPARATVRLICRDARIHKAIAASSRLDPSTRTRNVMVWVLRVKTPDGISTDYRFRATLEAVASYGGNRGTDVVNVFLDALDRRPTATRPRQSRTPDIA